MTHLNRLNLLVVVALVTVGCATEVDPDDTGGGMGSLTAEQEQALEDAVEVEGMLVSTFAAIEESFDLGEIVAPSRREDLTSPEAVAESRAASAERDLGDRCATITRAGLSITVDFADGCTLRSGSVVSGSLTANVSRADGATAFNVAFDELTLDARSVDGAMNLTLVAGAISASASLTLPGGTMDASFGVSYDGSTIILDGGYSNGGASYELTGLAYVRGDCYPSAGSLEIDDGGSSMTVVFDASTAATGRVMVSVGPLMIPWQLPAYGSCPSA